MFEALYMKISPIGRTNRNNLSAQGLDAQISRYCSFTKRCVQGVRVSPVQWNVWTFRKALH